MGRLDGKIALVTGASSGIGAATAIMFAKEGAKVVLASRNQEKLQGVRDSIEDAGGKAIIVIADVTKDADNQKAVEAAISEYGALHISFINAGAGSFNGFMEATDEEIDKLMGTNFKGVVFGLKHQLPAISKSGHRGSIIVDTSGAGERVSARSTGPSLYASSKAAANMMIKYGAVQGAPMNVRVTGIAPGVVKTAMASGAGEENMLRMAREGQLFGEPLNTDDIAHFVTFLASDDARNVTGSIYPCDAGAMLKF